MASIYNKIILSEKVLVDFNSVDANLKVLLENKIKNNIEGKCNNNGYIKFSSVKVISFSSGELMGSQILYSVVFECLVAYPVEGEIIECKVKSITKAGIKALIDDSDNNPYIIFIARDHHYNNDDFAKIETNNIINVKILGCRFELNDEFISVIGELINKNENVDIVEEKKSKVLRKSTTKSKSK